MPVDVNGDTIRVGPDGHIRHPTERDLVWWEFPDGTRTWVRQNRWCHYYDLKTEESAPEVYLNICEPLLSSLIKDCEARGIRYKKRPRKRADWNANYGPWEDADASQ